MSEFDNISDELFSCYLDGNCTEAEIRQIENAISTVDDLNILLLSKSVKHKIDKEMEGLPGFEKGKVIKFEPYVNLRAAGFLGNQDTANPPIDNANIDDEKQDE